MRGLPELVGAAAAVGGAAAATFESAETDVADGVPYLASPYLASRALWSASIAAERGTEAIPSGPAPGAPASASAKASPSAGPSFTPATTAPSSSIDFTPEAGESESSVAAMAFRPAPIWARRAATAAGATCGEPG